MPGQHNPYLAVARGAGWIDKRSRGRLRFDGRDAAAFLHALVSNDVESLQAGQGVYATYLTPQGRLLADLRIYHRGDHLIADVAPGRSEALATRLDLVIFTEDVRVTDVSSATGQIAVVGDTAASILARVFQLDSGAVAALPVWSQLGSGDTWIARTDDFDVPSFDVFMPAGASEAVIATLADAGATPVAPALADALRIDAGRPAFGVDMSEDTIPLEAGLLERAISQTKGCYVGQEVVIRILHRGGGRVVRRLVKVAMESADSPVPAAGTVIFSVDDTGDETREVGRITSAAYSPLEGQIIALGYVHRDAAQIGTRLSIGADAERRPGTVVALAG